MLCDHLEGWDREGGREGDARGKEIRNIYIRIADSLCYTAETNTPFVKQLYSNKDVKKNYSFWLPINHNSLLAGSFILISAMVIDVYNKPKTL